ncbi:hypothetical protein BVRB_019920 [Beta vulgaris subsp. vulgaris]|uniref:Dynein heavy chain linker domain-containing protein n=1 Tax=Beta vulgaris subsp. vulgaris TaxID=3555 RepID=A0A0J8DUU3_BETVV|nr:hypothetical protein BVRB_019920 [Beta vulgaris subsp. vulgaris]
MNTANAATIRWRNELPKLIPCRINWIMQTNLLPHSMIVSVFSTWSRRVILVRLYTAFVNALAEYLELEQIKSDFEPVSKLWSITDPGKIELETSSWWKDMYRLEKVLADRGAAASAEVASLTRAAIADFRLHVPTITNLRNPGLRPRHWQQISELLGQSVVPDQNLSWAQLLTLDINAHQ